MDRKVSLPLLRSLLYFLTCAWEFATTSRVGFLAFEVLLVVVEEEEPWRLVAAVLLPFIPPLLVQFLNILVTRTCQNKSWFGIPFCRSSKSYCLTSDGGKTLPPPPPPTCVFSGDFVSSLFGGWTRCILHLLSLSLSLGMTAHIRRLGSLPLGVLVVVWCSSSSYSLIRFATCFSSLVKSDVRSIGCAFLWIGRGGRHTIRIPGACIFSSLSIWNVRISWLHDEFPRALQERCFLSDEIGHTHFLTIHSNQCRVALNEWITVRLPRGYEYFAKTVNPKGRAHVSLFCRKDLH